VGGFANKKLAILDAACAPRVSHHNAAFLLRIRISKMRASERPLKSQSFPISKRAKDLFFGLNLMQEACYRFGCAFRD
jgi:hypothetical protein